MNSTTDIKNKEKSLAELMVRILKEPLNPLETSLQELLSEFSETSTKLGDIDLKLDVADSEILKINKLLRKVREEDFPALTLELQNEVVNRFSNEIKGVTKEIADFKINQNTMLREIAEEQASKLTEIVILCKETKQAIKDLEQRIDGKTEKIIQMIRQASEFSKTSQEENGNALSDLSSSSEFRYNQLLSAIDLMSVDHKNAAKNYIATVTEMSHLIINYQTATNEKIIMGNTSIVSALGAADIKINRIVVASVVFFVVMMAYIIYDIFFNQ
ncbi:hypothetical protein ACPFT2_001889 [Vibrio cholerae]